MAEENGADQQEDGTPLKVLIVGNSNTGKTAFLYRYLDDAFTEQFVSTVGIDFRVKTMNRGDDKYKVSIWDTAGQERYYSITKAYYKEAKGFLIFFDVAAQDTFERIDYWFESVNESCPDTPVILVGNKTDLAERVVTKESAEEIAKRLGVQYFETSVKDNVNVNEVFEALLDLMVQAESPEPPPPAEKPVEEEKPAEEKPVEEKPAEEKPITLSETEHTHEHKCAC